MKLSQWFERIGSHDIVDSEGAKADFLKETGQRAEWPEHTPRETAEAIRERGLGGSMQKDPAKKLAYGWEMAEAVAHQYASYNGGPFQGRGRRFHAAVEALVKAGL